MKKLPDITAACGNTPPGLICKKPAKTSGADIYGKLEYFNPIVLLSKTASAWP